MALTKVTGDFIKDGVLTQAHLHSSHGITTAHIGEGSNLYFTNARARDAISVSGNALSYNSSTGVITSNFEESPTFTGNATIETGINLESGVLVIKNATGDSNGLRIFQDSSDASKIYNNYNGTLQLGVGNTTAITIDSSENTTFAGDITVSGGDITLGGTGRIQGIDTVSAGTDAANKTYVDNQVAGIVDSAPSTLDTLNELAAALGDDANFSTTVTNSIATKLPLAGGTLTGILTINNPASDKKIAFRRTGGKSISIEHDTSQIYFYNETDSSVLFTIANNANLTTTGSISVSGGNSTQWNTAYTYSQVGHLPLAGGTLTGALNGTTATFSGIGQFAGAIRITENGTAQHILIGNQDSGGVNKPGMIRSANASLEFGYGNSWSGEGGTMTTTLTLHSNSNATFTGTITAGDGTQAINTDADLTLRNGNSFVGIDLKSARTSGNIGGLRYYGTSSDTVPKAQLLVETDGQLKYYNGTNGAQTRLTINSSGKVGIGTTSPDATLQVGANQNSNATGISLCAGSSVGNLIARTTTHHNWFPYTDGNNYYSAGTHNFRDGGNGSNYLTLTSSLATFAGDVTVSGSDLGIGGSPAEPTHGSVNTKIDLKGGADSLIIMRGSTASTEYGLYSYNGDFIITRTNQSTWWNNPDFKLNSGNATFAGTLTGTTANFATVQISNGTSYNENIRMFPSSSNDYSSLILGAVSGTSGTGVGQWTLVRYPAATHSNKFTIRHNGTDHVTIAVAGNVTNHVDTRSPIFYDSNDTNYYVNPAGDSVLFRTDINGGASYPLQVSSSQRYIIQARNTGNTVNSGYGWWWYTDTDFDMGFHADGAGDRMNLTRNGSLSSTGDMRAPIFYSSSDTSYYLYPNNQLSLKVYGEICNSNTAEGALQPGALNIGRVDTDYRWNGTTWASDVRLGMLINFSEYYEIGFHDSNDSVNSFVYYNGTDFEMGRDLGWGTQHFTFTESVRTPIYYDSNNTNYFYHGDNSASLAGTMNIWGGTSSTYGNQLILGQQSISAPYTLQDTNVRPLIYLTGQYPALTLNHTTTTNTNHGPTIQYSHNGSNNRQWVHGSSGDGEHFFFGYSDSTLGNSDHNPHKGIAGWNGTSMMTFKNNGYVGIGGDWGGLGGGDPAYAIDTKGTLYNNTDVRAPIFYDSNNTGYYADPAGTSVQNRIEIDDDLDVRAQTGTWITSNIMGDAIGWNTSYGVYIGSNVGGTHYLRGNGTFTTGGSTYNLWHEGNDSHLLRYKGSITSHDWNTFIDATEAGYNSVLNMSGSNRPPAYTYGIALSMAISGQGKAQFYFPETGSSSNGIYVRTGWNTAYRDWRSIALHNVNPQTGGSLYANTFYDSDNTGYYMNYLGGGTLRGNFQFAANSTSTSYNDASIELRESNYTANSSATPPFIGFHWGGVVASSIAIESNGRIAIRNNPGNAYEKFIASNIYASGDMQSPIYYDSNNTAYYINAASTSVINGLTMAGALQTAGSHTVGSSGTSNIYMGGVSGNYFRFHTNNSHTYFDGNVGDIHWRQGSSTRFIFYMTTANMTVNGTVTQNSDERIKENIITIDSALNKVNQLRGVYYNRTDINTSQKQIGLIAQEVENVIPEAVLTANDELGTKSISYGQINALLIEAIKEQQTIIDDLKSRLETLENQ